MVYTLSKLGLFIETVFTLAIVRLLVLCLPMDRLFAWLDNREGGSPYKDKATIDTYNQNTDVIERPHQQTAYRVGAYVRLISRYTPWRSMCLEQAIAARLLLYRRGIARTLYLGVRKQGETMTAHAWLECAGMVLTGSRGKEHFTPVLNVG